MNGNYDHATAKYAENGELIELYCKCCPTLIGEMTEKLSIKYPEKITNLEDGRIIIERFTERRFKINASYRLIFVIVADGSYATIAVCAECENKDHDLDKLSDVISREYEEDMKQRKRPQVEINLHKEIWLRDKKIVSHIKNSGDMEAIKNKLNLHKMGRAK